MYSTLCICWITEEIEVEKATSVRVRATAVFDRSGSEMKIYFT